MMSTNELCFTVLGPSGAGKTTMLACMYKKFDEILPGSFTADRAAFSNLQNAYHKLEQEANSSSLEFGAGVENTENLREYSFTITAGRANIQMRFFDFPGGWIDPAKSQTDSYKRVTDIVKRSRVIFVAVNTPYLMEANGRYKKEARIDAISYIIKSSLIDENDNKLILILPIKCEKYTRKESDLRKMYAVIEEEFSDLVSNHMQSLAIAVLPIHTVGNATFSRFEKQEGRLPREIYLKNRSLKFSPKYADQPLRYAMSFLLNEFSRGSDASFSDSLSVSDFKKFCAFIRGGMETDNGLFKFYNGQELVTEAPNIIAASESKPQLSTHDEVKSLKKYIRFLWCLIAALVTVIVFLFMRPPKVVVVEKTVERTVEKSFGQYLTDKIKFWK